MDVKELILINADKVRRDSNLLALYLESFHQAFGYKPNCAGCSFNSDWQKLVKFVNTGEKSLSLPYQNTDKNMNTFKLKKIQNKILSFKKDGITHRKYDNLFYEDFAVAFLTNGTESELAERRKLFAVLPEALLQKNLEMPTMENTANYMKDYAKQKGIDVSGLANKKDLLEAINKA